MLNKYSLAGWLRAIGLIALVSACAFELSPSPVTGYEWDDAACSDGRDNDDDGAIDCEDPDCVYFSVHCGLDIPATPPSQYPISEVPRIWENNLSKDDMNRDGVVDGDDIWIRCHDQIDNDNNGNFDCGDRACSNIPENCCAREFDNELCSDGVDNDQNGYTDCADFGCRRNPYVTVCVENTLADCTDGKDNDGDGRADCFDSDCGRLAGSDLELIRDFCGAEAEDTQERCSDGIDNDLNGYTDCDDFSCSRNENQGIVQFCEEQAAQEAADQSGEPEDSDAACSDGIDNDNNGYTDCDDFSCTRNDAVTVCGGGGTPEVTDLSCSDGVDNDNDGFVDCADADCSWSPAVTVCNDVPRVCEAL